MTRYRLHIIIAATLICAGGGIGYRFCTAGVTVSVRNTGQEMMRDVTVLVTGRRYSIGDLAPGGSRSRRVSPTSESSVEVEFTDAQGGRILLMAGGYLESGYRGQMDIEIRDRKIAAVNDEIQGPY